MNYTNSKRQEGPCQLFATCMLKSEALSRPASRKPQTAGYQQAVIRSALSAGIRAKLNERRSSSKPLWPRNTGGTIKQKMKFSYLADVLTVVTDSPEGPSLFGYRSAMIAHMAALINPHSNRLLYET